MQGKEHHREEITPETDYAADGLLLEKAMTEAVNGAGNRLLPRE